MSDVVIQVENLTKEYRLGTINHGTLYRDLQSWWARLRGKEDPNSLISHHPSTLTPQPSTSFLALNDVSFKVKQGDIVGIIGRNGAGKSTLLKILSQVTSPTSGEVRLNGRVASLLEVGTGFHPELTGRENVFLNGAILGMSKAEITRKFDEIIAFAEIDNFIDTPVKRYSSGMYVRLAFAVAAHLEPEILIIDEVLAVGDAQFQKKCLGKMQEVGKEGRTVLFVSHNMDAISTLCDRSIMLQNGILVEDGSTNSVVERYFQESYEQQQIELKDRKDRIGDGRIRFSSIKIINCQGQQNVVFSSGESLTILVEYNKTVMSEVSNVVVAFGLLEKKGTKFATLSNIFTGEIFNKIDTERGFFRCTIPRLPMTPGRYSLNAIIRSGAGIEDYVLGVASFEVAAGDYFASGHVVEGDHGLVYIDHNWQAE